MNSIKEKSIYIPIIQSNYLQLNYCDFLLKQLTIEHIIYILMT